MNKGRFGCCADILVVMCGFVDDRESGRDRGEEERKWGSNEVVVKIRSPE